MISDSLSNATRGGIDFNPEKMNVDVRHAGQRLRFRLDFDMLRKFEGVTGFEPIIIDMQPMALSGIFFGLNRPR